MRHRRNLRDGLIVVSLLAAILLVVGMLLRIEPASYREVAAPEGEQRRELSAEFTKRFRHLMDAVGNGEEQWSETFTTDQINSYLAEEFFRVQPFHLPEDIHSPRVSIEPDRLRLTFRYGRGFWSTVITVDLKIWLVAQEVNLLAVEILDVRAGVVPLAVQSILERIAENASSWKAEVTWYRHGRNPVALVRWQPDQPNPPIVMEQFELLEQQLRLGGRSTAPFAWGPAVSMNRRRYEAESE
ncbi:MAG: hypothetical protein N2039_12490 [Gemmataceae bacterium]|nr:hypothetical protein [Gemmataceae bacterium]